MFQVNFFDLKITIILPSIMCWDLPKVQLIISCEGNLLNYYLSNENCIIKNERAQEYWFQIDVNYGCFRQQQIVRVQGWLSELIIPVDSDNYLSLF